MKKELNTTEQYFATTRNEAERIIEQAREEIDNFGQLSNKKQFSVFR